MPRSVPSVAAAGLLAAFALACAPSADRVLAPDPGTPASPATAPNDAVVAGASLVFTELLPNPVGTDDPAEWFEVHNAADTTVNLRGFVFGTANEPAFTVATDLVVPARGHALFVRGAAGPAPAGVPRYSYATAAGAPGNWVLNNSNTDWVTVKTPEGALVDSVAYARRPTPTGTPGPFAPPNGAAVAKRSPVRDCSVLADADAWGAATTVYDAAGNRGTPGAANDVGGYAYTGSCAETPPPGEVATVTVASASVQAGQTVTLVATARDASGAVVGTTFTWSGGDPAIATVNPTTGVATGVAAGATTVRATAATGQFGEATLTVTAAPPPGAVTRIDVVGRSLGDPPLPVGFQDQLFADAFDAGGRPVTTTFTWGTTTPALLTVDRNGVVTALAAGAGVVTVTADVDGFSRTWSIPTVVAAASATAVYGEHLEFGALAAPAPDVVVVTRPQYVAAYDRVRGTPNWVAYNLEASHIGALDRCDCFTPDPLLPADFPAISTNDYTNSGYSRGHLVKSADRTAGSLDNAVTFYFSNIIPQTAANNGGAWLELENHLSDLARDADREIYVHAGPAGSLGTLKNEGKVTIPASVWKVAVVMDRDRGLADVDDPSDLEIIAINVPNTPTVPGGWADYRVSVDALEALTGYDLLSRLPDGIEAVVEAQVGVRNVEMDVQPSNVSLSATPVVNVVLLSRPGFDASAVDAAATRLVVNGGTPVAPARRGSAVQTSVADANGDGRPDRLVTFATAELRAAGLTGPPAELVLRLATTPSAWEARDAALPAIVP